MNPTTSTLGVIFDLDGTLAHTLDDITDAMNLIFESRGLPSITRERVRELIGEGLKNLLRQASGIEDDDQLDAFVRDYGDLYSACLLKRTQLYPGVPAMLDELTRLGIPMAVLSNKPHQFTAPICDALLSPWPFVQCRGWQEDKPRKPDPTTALELADALGRPPRDVYFVGDSSVDIKTGQRAGMTSVAVTWGYRDLDDLHPAAPDHCIHEPTQLVALLDDLTHPRSSVP